MSAKVDHFAALGLERSAALDEALVRERFHEMSRGAHPDAEGGDEVAFAAINEAQRVLRSPAARLRHLLDLAGGDGLAGGGVMSDDLMVLFELVASALEGADDVITKRRAATTALSKALLSPQELAAQQTLMGAGGRLRARRQEIEDSLAEIGVGDRASLTGACHELAFLEKWQQQVQERMGALL